MVTQIVREVDWKSVIEHLINFGKNLGPGSAAVFERLVVLRAALHNFSVTLKGGIEDLNTRAENLRNDLPTDSAAEMPVSGEPSQGSELRELQPTEGLKRRAPYPRTSEDLVDGVHASGVNERPEP